MQLKDSWIFWWRTVSYRSPVIGTPNHVRYIKVALGSITVDYGNHNKSDTQRENENLGATHGIIIFICSRIIRMRNLSRYNKQTADMQIVNSHSAF